MFRAIHNNTQPGIEICSNKGIRTNYFGKTRAEAIRRMLDAEEIRYNHLKGIGGTYLNDHGRDLLDSLQDFFL